MPPLLRAGLGISWARRAQPVVACFFAATHRAPRSTWLMVKAEGSTGGSRHTAAPERAGAKASFGFDHDVGVFNTDGKRLSRVGALHKLCSRLH